MHLRRPGARAGLAHNAGRRARRRGRRAHRLLALDAVQIAVEQPRRQVVFAGIGFETTAPTVAAALLTPRSAVLANFSVLSMHKTMPAPLQAPARPRRDAGRRVHPARARERGHRDARCYGFLARDYGVAGVVAGFEPHDVLEALLMLVRQQQPAIDIEYTRAVQPEGNRVAQRIIEQVFEPCDAEWRGLGVIPGSGSRVRPPSTPASMPPGGSRSIRASRCEPAGCRCGEVLRGVIDPAECALFGAALHARGSRRRLHGLSEGACAAHYRFRGIDG